MVVFAHVVLRVTGSRLRATRLRKNTYLAKSELGETFSMRSKISFSLIKTDGDRSFSSRRACQSKAIAEQGAHLV